MFIKSINLKFKKTLSKNSRERERAIYAIITSNSKIWGREHT